MLTNKEEILKSYNPNEPIWVIGPSIHSLKFKDLICQNLQNKNVITIGHCLHEILSNWDFVPNFFTWLDPHQTHRLFGQEQLFLNLNKKINFIVPECITSNKKNMNSSAFGDPKKNKVWKAYHRFLEFCHSSEKINFHRMPTIMFHSKNPKFHSQYPKEVAQIKSNPEYRFNCKYAVLGEPKFTVQNILTFSILPTLHYLNFKTIFVLGFDGNWERFYPHAVLTGKTPTNPKYRAGGWPKYINPAHRKMHTIQKWMDWQPYHKLKIYNLQDESPLNGKIPFMTFQESLEYNADIC